MKFWLDEAAKNIMPELEKMALEAQNEWKIADLARLAKR